MVQAMSPPSEPVTPVTVTSTPDGAGGSTASEAPGTPFLAKVSAARDANVLSDSSDNVMSRLVVSWPYDEGVADLEASGRVTVRGLSFTVRTVNISDQNPLWRRALVVRDD
jgi:hypothetical protein